jgi:hypothetical protein
MELEKMTGAGIEDFEAEMIALNFVLGKYGFYTSSNTSIIQCPNEVEFLKHAVERDDTVNRASGLFFKPVPIKTVLAKEVNLVNKQMTYMFQKDSGTVVKMTVAVV